MAVTPIEIASPFIYVNGGQAYKYNFETTADQVKMPDGQSVTTRLTTLENTVSGKATMREADTIADRDALATSAAGLIFGDTCFVRDASDDPTVESGSAVYRYMTDGTWLKILETESMDIVCTWEHIQNKPESTVAQIDLAVAKQHVHDNKLVLDLLEDDGANNLLYKGKRINDGKVWTCMVGDISEIPANLADGGIVLINPAMAQGTGA